MKHRQPWISNKLPAEPYTQWEVGVESPSSACGPATMAALTEYWNTYFGADFIRGKVIFLPKPLILITYTAITAEDLGG